jgi:hypothetical protein
MQLCNECIDTILQEILKMSKEIFTKENEIRPVAIPVFFDEECFEIDDVIEINCEDDKDKTFSFLSIGAKCWMQDAEDVVLVMGCLSRKIEDLDYFIENLETEKPSMYPESMRDNLLVLTYIDLIDEEHRVLICNYKKENEKFVFNDDVRFVDGKEMQSGIVEMVLNGWNLMHRFIDNQDDDEEDDNDEFENDHFKQ